MLEMQQGENQPEGAAYPFRESQVDVEWGTEGERHFAEGHYDEARRCFEKALLSRPFDAKIHNNLSVTLWQQGSTQDALRHLTQALELDPNDQDVILNCARCFTKLGRKEYAREVLEAYLGRNPWDHEVQKELDRIHDGVLDGQGIDHAAFLNEQGEDQFARGKKDHARVCFELALEQDPQSARAHNNLGVLFWDHGDGPKALEHLSRAMDLAPEDGEMMLNASKVLAASGELETAADLLQCYLQRKPQDASAWKDYRQLLEKLVFSWENKGLPDAVGDIYLRMGEALAEAGDPLGAAEAFARAAQFDAQQAEACYRLGKQHMALDQRAEAAAWFEQAFQRNASQKNYALAYGEALLALDQAEQARAILEAFPGGSEDGEVAAFLANIPVPGLVGASRSS